MNRRISLVALAAGTLMSLAGAAAQTLSSAINNSATDTRYYRLTWNGATWTQMRDFARGMGGDLVTINDATEQAWIIANVVLPNDKYFIGLNDAAVEGQLVWSDGSPSTYRNLADGNGGNNQGSDFALLTVGNGGQWDVRNSTWTSSALIEVSGPVRIPGEFAAITQAAVDFALASSGAIQLAAGTFTQTTLVVANSSLTIRGAGPSTIIQGVPNGETFRHTASAVYEDLTLINRGSTELIESTGASLTLRRCRMSSILLRDGNELLEVGNTAVLLDSCTINATDYLVNFITSDAGSVQMVNSTFSDANGITTSTDTAASILLTNCVLSNVTRQNITSTIPTTISNTILDQVTGNFHTNTVFNSCLAPTALPGNNNRTGNAAFVNASAGDFRLTAASAAIDTGDASLFMTSGAPNLIDAMGKFRVRDAIGINDPSGVAPIDIGAFEFQGDQGCDDIDFNNDGSLFDPMDVDAFLSVFSEGPCIR
jgi:hypothetical protein